MAKKPSKLDQAIAEARGESPAVETGTAVATFAPDQPLAIFEAPEKFDSLLGTIREAVANHKPDVTTAKGRGEIKSLAFKVAKTRTTLDAAGKALNESKRVEIDAVDAQRREFRAALEALEAEARKPLDDWEKAEAARKATVAEIMERINLLRDVPPDAESAHIQERLRDMDALEFDADIFQDDLQAAVMAKLTAVNFLNEILNRVIQAEADAAELARLRKAQADRDAADAAAAAEAAAEAERVRKEQEAAEAEAAAEAERKRLAREAEAAEAEKLAEAASIAAAQAAQEAQAKIDEANAEAERLRKEIAKREADAAAAAAEQAARDADRAHRGAVMKAAKEAIISVLAETEDGATDDGVARAIVLAIVAGEIPSVRLTF